MNHRPWIEARRGVNVRAGFDKRLGMKAGTGLDDLLGHQVPRGSAGGLVGGANRLPQHAHELEIEARGDQISRGGDSHSRR